MDDVQAFTTETKNIFFCTSYFGNHYFAVLVGIGGAGSRQTARSLLISGWFIKYRLLLYKRPIHLIHLVEVS